METFVDLFQISGEIRLFMRMRLISTTLATELVGYAQTLWLLEERRPCCPSEQTRVHVRNGVRALFAAPRKQQEHLRKAARP